MVKMNKVAIILARGGSKGIKNKNIIQFCNKPLIYWTIKNCIDSNCDSIWVSSDSNEILQISKEMGVNIIKRPKNISDDLSTSESAWIHAINFIESKNIKIDLIIAPQVTSPLRDKLDIGNAINIFIRNKYDSLFSCCKIEDFFIWNKMPNGKMISENYDYKSRKRRQDINSQYVENGSFYIFKPHILKTLNNRLGGKIGIFEMSFHKLFEIDSQDDIDFCTMIMKNYILNK